MKQPRVLFVSYFFPPLHAVACIRTWGMAKALAKRGWRVDVITPGPGNWIRNNFHPPGFLEMTAPGGPIRLQTVPLKLRGLTPDRTVCSNRGVGYLANGLLRRFFKKFGIEAELGWRGCASAAVAKSDLKAYDLIFVSGGPFCVFPTIEQVATKWRLPFAVDYRDLWTCNPHLEARKTSSAARRREASERRILKAAAAISGVSPSMGDLLREMVDDPGKVAVLTNGYAPEELEATARDEQGEILPVSYLGGFYPPLRGVDPIFKAILLLRDQRRIDPESPFFHYFGDCTKYVESAAKEYGIERLVRCHGNVGRAQALSAELRSKICVVVTTVGRTGTQAEHGILPGKCFELLGAGVRALVVCPEGADMRRLTKTLRSVECRCGDDVPGIAEVLARCTSGPIERFPVPVEFSWEKIGEKFEGIMRRCAENGAKHRLPA